MRALRLAWRLQRSEILFAAAACLVLTAAAGWLTLDMYSALDRCETAVAATACDVVFAFQDTHGSSFELLQMLIEYVPFVVGLLLGVPLVTREVEHRTALIAWPMAGSRLRWLAWRLVPMLLIGLALVGVLATVADQMVRAYYPHGDIGFSRFETRGLPLVTRTGFVLVAGVAMGAIVGRLLPTLLLGIALSVAVVVGLAIALPLWVPATVLADIETDPAAMIGGRLHTAVQYRLPSGEVVSADEGEAFVQVLHEQAGGEPDAALMPEMIITGVGPDRYLEVVARESVALGAGALVLVGLAAVVLQRRRPE